MTKSLDALQKRLDELYELKEKAETANSDEAGLELGQQVFDGAMELLSTGKDFAPEFTRTDKEGLQEQLDWLEREIKSPARELRDWFIERKK